jgi:4-diphosphocytidyl-2-C-methyl-D-erythritol kinase
MTMTRSSPCKVNLILNILGKRPDGFHELETVMQPVALHDELAFERAASGVSLSCNDASLPTDGRNLVHRAATAFLLRAAISEGVRIHLEKRIPLAAGLGGGSGNAANTLLGLNELFGHPMAPAALNEIAASLGSDIPFFLQSGPGLGTGRGEKIEPLPPFRALRGAALLLVHPGFGISTPWAYQNLARFPSALKGTPGRAAKLIELLNGGDLRAAAAGFYNSLEAPALEKHPILELYQQFFREHGAAGTLMSGSGSTTFAVADSEKTAREIEANFRSRFGASAWLAVVNVG